MLASTSVPFLIYLPLFASLPRLINRIDEVDLYWFLPLAMVVLCIVLSTWALLGRSDVLRVIWSLAFFLAVISCPFAYLIAIMMGTGALQPSYGQPAERGTVSVEPPLPVPRLERP